MAKCPTCGQEIKKEMKSTKPMMGAMKVNPMEGKATKNDPLSKYDMMQAKKKKKPKPKKK